MKRLVVFWKLHSMSKDVAKKAMCQGGKTYEITPQRTEFDPNKDPKEAILEILREHGERPEVNPFRGMTTEHSFAEIMGHKIAEVSERGQAKEVKCEDLELPL